MKAKEIILFSISCGIGTIIGTSIGNMIFNILGMR
jgi:hypothetical protein